MSEHLRRVSSKQCADHYCSKRIQNELINLLGNKVLQNIQNRLKKSKYFSIILDCTPDLSHSEKMSFTLRFVEEENGRVSIKEHFIGFRTVHTSKGEGLAEV